MQFICDDNLLEVFTFLELPDLVNCSLVSRKFHKFYYLSKLWHNFVCSINLQDSVDYMKLFGNLNYRHTYKI